MEFNAHDGASEALHICTGTFYRECESCSDLLEGSGVGARKAGREPDPVRLVLVHPEVVRCIQQKRFIIMTRPSRAYTGDGTCTL